MNTTLVVTAVVAASLATRCAPSLPVADSGLDAGVFDLAVEQLSSDGGVTALATDSPLQFYLGFQGFIYARIRFASRSGPSTTLRGRSTLHIDGYDPIPQNYDTLPMQPDGSAVRSRFQLLFANDVVLSSLRDRRYTLDVTLFDGPRTGTAHVSGTIFYDAHCIADGNGACLPPDAGLDATGSDGGSE